MLVDDEKNINRTEINEFNEKYSTIEDVLKRYFNDKDLRVLKMKCLSGSKEGDNYMSVVKRIIVEFDTSSGTFHSTSLIVKRHIVDKARRELFRCDAAFKNEIAAYCHIIPVLKRFSNNNLPIPNNYFAGCDKDGEIMVVMEDLNIEGLKMVNRLDGFDFDHCSVVLKELGRFHALSLAMKIIEPIKFFSAVKHIHEVVFIEHAADFYSQQLDSSLNQAISSLMEEINESDEFDMSVKILKKLKGGNLFSIMMNHVTNSEDKFNVIVHGDLWSNNVMFHYGKNGRVNYAKFVDLQTLRYSNMVCDILMVIFSSTKYKMRNQHMDELIDLYHNSLIDTLRKHLKCNHSRKLAELEKIYTSESIKEEMARRSLFGLGMSLWVLPAITFLPNVKNLDSLMNSLNDSDKHDEIMASMKSNEYHIRIRDIVREFNQRGYLRNIFIDI